MSRRITRKAEWRARTKNVTDRSSSAEGRSATKGGAALVIQLSGTASVVLGILLVLLGLSIVLLVVDVLRSADLDPKQKAAWVVAFLLGTFFTAVIYFAQGRTSRLGRIASVCMALAILLSLVVISVLVLRM
jgi:uncharacterized membrane protein